MHEEGYLYSVFCARIAHTDYTFIKITQLLTTNATPCWCRTNPSTFALLLSPPLTTAGHRSWQLEGHIEVIHSWCNPSCQFVRKQYQVCIRLVQVYGYPGTIALPSSTHLFITTARQRSWHLEGHIEARHWWCHPSPKFVWEWYQVLTQVSASIWCRVPARWGLQRTTLAPGSDETGARWTWSDTYGKCLDNLMTDYLKLKNTDRLWICFTKAGWAWHVRMDTSTFDPPSTYLLFPTARQRS